MPTLPTLTISDMAIWNRLLAAFNSDPAAYRDWLKKELAQYVLDYETNQQVAQRKTELTDGVNTAT